jgi:tRNA threonylcarbamoyl adenosine modification protein (Sua5/YciO/YrdC/YwlC family)
MRTITIDVNHPDAAAIHDAAKVLSDGGIVAIPTETVYGLAGRFDRKDTIARLYAVKNRPDSKPFTLAAGDALIAKNLFLTLPPFGYRLIEEFWPGPLTIIYYSKNDQIIGARVPDHPVAARILKDLNALVCLPSANLSGGVDSTTAQEVERDFSDKIDLIVDSGPCRHGRPSTIVDLTFYPFKVLREGAVSEQHVIETFSRRRLLFVCTGNTCRSPMAQFLTQIYLSRLSPYATMRYEVLSRGIAAANGTNASSGVVDVIREKENIDVKGFTSCRLNRDILLSSDLIFTMEDEQYDYILQMEPTVDGRLFHMKNFLPPDLDRDIGDPIGHGLDAYRNLHETMKLAIGELVKWL